MTNIIRPQGIEVIGKMPSPEELHKKYALTQKSKQLVSKSRDLLGKIITGEITDVKVASIGPCSLEESIFLFSKEIKGVLSNFDSGKEFLGNYKDKILTLIRLYPEKPRTRLRGEEDWKGLTYSRPGEELDLAKGIDDTVRIFSTILNEFGIPIITESLDPQYSKYLDPYITTKVIGARSVEDQIRKLHNSGEIIPVFGKNPTSGDLSIMANFVEALKGEQIYPYGNDIIKTYGNPWSAGMLRGGKIDGEVYSNCNKESIREAMEVLKNRGLEKSGIVMDLSHDNAYNGDKKDPKKQTENLKELIKICNDNPELKHFVKGFSAEAHLKAGNQKPGPNAEEGVSYVDVCCSVEDAKEMLKMYSDSL